MLWVLLTTLNDTENNEGYNDNAQDEDLFKLLDEEDEICNCCADIECNIQTVQGKNWHF